MQFVLTGLVILALGTNECKDLQKGPSDRSLRLLLAAILERIEFRVSDDAGGGAVSNPPLLQHRRQTPQFSTRATIV
jgi:hypothetical protein